MKDGGEEVKAIGRRKTSCAVVRIKRGAGQVTINGCPFISYFPRVEDRQQVSGCHDGGGWLPPPSLPLQVLYPLALTGLLGQHDITVSVHGGGVTGRENN